MRLISKKEYLKDVTNGKPFLNYNFFNKYIPEEIIKLKKHSVENSMFLHIALFEKYFETGRNLTMSNEDISNLIKLHTL